MASMGWSVPISLLANMTDTSARVVTDGRRHVLDANNAVFVHIQQRYLKALPAQLVKRVQHRMVLKILWR